MLKTCIVCSSIFDCGGTRDRSPFALTCSRECSAARKRQREKGRKGRKKDNKAAQLRMANKAWYGK